MERSPDRLNLEHLKKQAKDLIRLYRQHDREAFIRFRRALPAAAGRSDDEVASLNLRLHDAQSCVARDYGFASWQDLRRYIEAQQPTSEESPDRVLRWLQLVYSGDVDGTTNRANQRVAARMLAENPTPRCGQSLSGLRRRRRARASADYRGGSRMAQSSRRTAAIAAAFCCRALQPAAHSGISHATTSQRALPA